MREAGLPEGLLEMVGARDLRRYAKVAVALLALLSCLVLYYFLKAYIQPANAMGIGAATPIDDFYGDGQAYYCAHYRLQGSSIAAACRASEMVADSIMTAQTYTGGVYLNGCSAYDSIFRHYAWDVSVAEAICQAESGGNPYSVSPTNDYGLMQLHGMAIFDPSQNIAAAYRKYQVQGWGAWTSYNTGAYRRFGMVYPAGR